MQEKVLAKLDSDKLRVFVVWMSVVEGDGLDAAVESSKKLPDPRVSFFWAPTKDVGVAFAKVLQLPKGFSYAWDVYLAYAAGIEWKDEPPAPTLWMHQLSALRDRTRLDGDKLREALAKLIEDLK